MIKMNKIIKIFSESLYFLKRTNNPPNFIFQFLDLMKLFYRVISLTMILVIQKRNCFRKLLADALQNVQ